MKAEKYAEYYDTSIAKKFKNLTKEVFIKMQLNGGVKKYMDKFWKDHKVPEHKSTMATIACRGIVLLLGY
jgi:hypothetical protein